MLFRIPEQFFGFLAVWLTGVYLAIFMLNIFVFNLDRSRYKKLLKIFLFVIVLGALPAALIIFRKVPWLEQTMLFEATNPGARWALSGLAVLWTTALVCQIVTSLRVVMPVRSPHWIGKRTRKAPYSPRHEDWDALRNEDWERTPPPPLDGIQAACEAEAGEGFSESNRAERILPAF